MICVRLRSMIEREAWKRMELEERQIHWKSHSRILMCVVSYQIWIKASLIWSWISAIRWRHFAFLLSCLFFSSVCLDICMHNMSTYLWTGRWVHSHHIVELLLSMSRNRLVYVFNTFTIRHYSKDRKRRKRERRMGERWEDVEIWKGSIVGLKKNETKHNKGYKKKKERKNLHVEIKIRDDKSQERG